MTAATASDYQLVVDVLTARGLTARQCPIHRIGTTLCIERRRGGVVQLSCRLGCTEQEILAALGLSREGAKVAAEEDSGRFSDAVLAERAAAEALASRFRWCAGLGWLEWDGRRWIPRDDAIPTEAVRVYVRGLYLEAVAGTTDPRVAKSYAVLLAAGKIRNVTALARGIAGVHTDAAEFDADPDLLNTPRGVVDLTTGRILAHDPVRLITKITSGNYRPGFTHADWDAALEALPPDKRAWLQVRIGQGATGHRTPDGIIVVMQGAGENGKSLVTTDGVVPAMGDYATLASAKLISDTHEHSEERATLRGKRLLVAEEMTEGRSLNVTAIKQISDVGIITARHVYGRNMTFPATHTLFVTTNYLPVVNETDHGTWRRLALLVFPYTFRKPGEDLAADSDRRGDPGLKRRIEDNATAQHDAIVTWVVEGAMRWHSDGAESLAVPAAVATETNAWRCEADRILGFWTERLCPDPSARVLATDMFAAFTDWLKENGHQPWAKETFAPRFEGHAETSRNRVGRRRELSPENVSRYVPSVWDTATKVPEQPVVWRGVRFQDAL